MEQMISVFFKKEKEINEFMDSKFEEIKQIELSENINLDYEINIIFFHNNKININKEIFQKLKEYESKASPSIKFTINIYDFDYEYKSNSINSFDTIKNDLIKKKNKKIYILILYYLDTYDGFFLKTIFDILKPNYLSYLFLISNEKIILNYISLEESHIKSFKYEKSVDDLIKVEIINKFDEIQKNYKEFLIKNQKYNKILEEYDKSYKYKVITTPNNNVKEGKMTFKEIINEHKQLLIEKIAQDISFILCLSVKKKNDIKILIEEDLNFIIKESNDKIQSFLNHQKITNELRKILISFIKILKENDKNNIFQNLNEKENTIQYDEKIISIDGIQKMYEDDEINDKNNDDIIQDKNIKEVDKGEDLRNISKDDGNKTNIKNEEEEKAEEIQSDEEDSFKISLLIHEIKDKLQYSILLINLKLYYKYFSTIIRKIFINNVAIELSKNVLEEKK